MSEVNGTGIVPKFEEIEQRNDKGEVVSSYCKVKAGDDVITKPYQDNPDYPVAVYNWHETMSAYIKNDLDHKDHLIGPSYAGEPRADRGDLTFQSELMDFCSFNVYTPNTRLFYTWVERSQKYNKTGKIVYRGENENTQQGNDPKPLMFSEIGIADYYRCDDDIGDIKMVLISPFCGISGMGLNWDNNDLPNSQNWYLYGNVNKFLNGVNLANIPWTSYADETSWDEIEYLGELICLQSEERFKRAMGVVHNRSWNYYTKGDPNQENPCGEDWVLGVGDKEVSAFRTYKDLKYDFPFGPYPFKLKRMGVLKRYIIEWYDPFTLDIIKVDTRSSTVTGKLWLEYPNMSTTEEGKQPIYWFKLYPEKRGGFEELPSE